MQTKPRKIARFNMHLDYLRELIGLGHEYRITQVFMDPEYAGTIAVNLEGPDLKEISHGDVIPPVRIVCTKIYCHPEYLSKEK